MKAFYDYMEFPNIYVAAGTLFLFCGCLAACAGGLLTLIGMWVQLRHPVLLIAILGLCIAFVYAIRRAAAEFPCYPPGVLRKQEKHQHENDSHTTFVLHSIKYHRVQWPFPPGGNYRG